MAFKLATLFVDVVTNQGNFDRSLVSMRGSLGPLVALTQRMADEGSNLIETMNKVDVAFGGSAGKITGFANEMADRFGSVRNETLNAASSMGLILQAAGQTKDKSADLSIQLVKLADDMKSLYHIPLEDALRKIQSGLVGQSRPLREYGVLLSAAAVNAELVAAGVQKVSGQFSEQDKVMARLKIITEGLKVAQGDHARTMDQYANQVDMLKGKWENYRTSIGAGIAGAEAKVMVNVVEKGWFKALGEHMASIVGGPAAGEAQRPELDKLYTSDNQFQKGADVAAGVQKGLTAEMFKPTPEMLHQMELDRTVGEWRAAEDVAQPAGGQKQLDELQQIRKLDEEQLKMFREFLTRSTVGVLG